MSSLAQDSDLEEVTPVGFFTRHLQQNLFEFTEEEEMTEQEEDKVRLSVYFILAYLVYLVVSFVILKFVSKFDLILGLVRFMRKTGSSITCMNVTIVLYLCFFMLCPIIIALAWSLDIYSGTSDNDGVIAAAIFLMLMFSTFVILGSLVWYGNKWHVSKAVVIFYSLGAFAAWLFTLVVSLTNENYTYSGVSAIILATNFLPAAYILHKRTVWKDVPLYGLFKNLAFKIMTTTEQDHAKLLDMTPVQKRDHKDKKMKETLTTITDEENQYLRTRLFIAGALYLGTMAAYLAIFLAKEDDKTIRGLALLNPIFLLGSDIVVASLRRQAIKIRKQDKGNFVYSTTFQSLVLLFNRVLLCYNKEYWLCNLALVYFVVQLVCAYDATQTFFLNTKVVRNEQDDIIELLRISPVLSAKVSNTLPELKTNFEYHPEGCCCDLGKYFTWRKFRTQVFSFVYFIFFALLNYIVSTEPESLMTKRVVFYTEVGQWVYGYFSIATAIVIVFYILWYRSFKNSSYKMNCTSLLLAILFEVISVLIGIFFYSSVDSSYDIILTSFTLLPIVAVSFTAFFGIWVSNDFNGYEYGFVHARKMKPEQIDAYNNLSGWEKMKQGSWKPSTRKDWVLFSMLAINIITILFYWICSAIMFKPAYVGITISLLILVFEMAFIMVWKYRAVNFQMTFEVVFAMLISVGLMLVWVLYIVLELIMDDNEADSLKAAAVLVAISYFVILIFSLLYMEWQAAKQETNRLSCSFWILFGLTWIILIGVGGAMVVWSEYGLLGIVWVSVCIYIILNLLLNSWKRVIDVAYCTIFVFSGIVLLLTSKDNEQSFQGISVLYFGMLILSFGAFCQEYIINKMKKRKSIFMASPQVFPMLQYDLNTAQMHTNNKEPLFFFFFIYVVLLWAFSCTVIAPKQWRYIPLSIIGIALAFATIYIMEKNVDATTVDRKFFKQGTSLFYTSCMITATEYKKKWRNKDRNIVDIAANKDHLEDEKRQFENRTVYYNELIRVDDWKRTIYSFKGKMGFLGWFDSMGGTSSKLPVTKITTDPQDNSVHHSNSELMKTDNEALPLGDNQAPGTVSKKRFTSVSGDDYLETLEGQLTDYMDKETKQLDAIDCWADMVEKAREEDYYDKKYWAFLNGYLNLKMGQLLETEVAIIEQSIKSYIRDLKTKEPKSTISQKIDIGNFLAILKDEPKVIEGFTLFLTEELLHEALRQNKNKDGDNPDVVSEDEESEEEEKEEEKEEDPNSKEALERKEQIKQARIARKLAKKEEKKRARREKEINELKDDVNEPDYGPNNSIKKLSNNLDQLKQKYSNKDSKFNMDTFQKEQQDLIANILIDRNADAIKAAEEARKRDLEREEKRKAAAEARDLERMEREQRKKIVMNEVQEVAGTEDERILKIEGDKALAEMRSTGASVFVDEKFDFETAKDGFSIKNINYDYVRVKEIRSNINHTPTEKTLMFSDGVSANDIMQGALGDCYLLSAFSIIAHTRPELIKKIFHPESRSYRDDGIYSVMLYSSCGPEVITLDDRFFTMRNSRVSLFTRLITDQKTDEREMWPLLLEKAYAKFHGSYQNIKGGNVDVALQELTNGVGFAHNLRDSEIEEEFNTGELWNKLLWYKKKNYMMGNGSKPGSDTTSSGMGIVNGHAYSILDVAVIDGYKLVQVRNPWGKGEEWTGDWGDTSDLWTQKRKIEAYKHMKETGRVQEIGKEGDGTFWMAFNDWYHNFETLYLCRFFGEEYTEIFFESEWKKDSATAGGCTNHESYPFNPQMAVHVKAKSDSQPIECFMQLKKLGLPRGEQKKTAIGFDVWGNGGKKITDRYVQNRIMRGTYKYANSVIYDGEMPAQGKPCNLVCTSFNPDEECKFRFTLWYKHSQGTINLVKI